MKPWIIKNLRLFIVFPLLFPFLVLTPIFADASTASIDGQWLTIDDYSHQPRGIVEITHHQDKWQGQLIKIYYLPGEGPRDICEKCTDVAHKNQPILGMVLLWNMEKIAENQWRNGYILDPKNGHIYRCQMILNPDQRTLRVRGYIGITLLGRTQRWQRIETQTDEAASS